MTPNKQSQIQTFTPVLIAVTAVGLLLFGPISTWVQGQGAAAMKTSPAAQLAALGMKFNGAAGCKGSGCHNKDGDDAPPKEREHEYNIWKEKDRHSKAYTTLTEKASTDIGTKMKIADVKVSDKCLSCHALNVAANLRGKDYSIKEGNTCENCHGPSEKWLQPHSKKGWQDDQRKALNHDQLLKQFGLYDTRPLVVRAEMCASCHLSIEPEMIAAGHPQPSFELAYYSDVEPKHWIDAAGYFNTKVWMAGQLVCVREAMQQLSSRVKAKASADAIKAAWQQALAHAMVFQPAAQVAGLDAAGFAAHAKALAALTPADGDKIAAEADAIAKICEDGKAKVAAFDPDANKASTTQLLQALASLTGMGKNYGTFGMDQQTMGISSLYASYETGSKTKSDAINKLIQDKLFPEKAPSADDFEKNVAAVKDKLPK